jgi:hypothetical protein
MTNEYKVYCDESCHLQNDGIPAMVLGGIWCPASQVRLASRRLAEIKAVHRLAPDFEIKWTKVSAGQQQFYLDLVSAFFDDEHLHFRGLLIPDKTKLDHVKFNQSHDDWYYKMCFQLLDPIINPANAYSIYLDIKDTRSEDKRANLEKVLRNANRDRALQIIRRVQQVRSNEVILLQLADLFIGAIGYHARGLQTNPAKLAVIRRIRQRGKLTLDRSTWLGESKFNLFRWSAQGELHERTRRLAATAHCLE